MLAGWHTQLLSCFAYKLGFDDEFFTRPLSIGAQLPEHAAHAALLCSGPSAQDTKSACGVQARTYGLRPPRCCSSAPARGGLAVLPGKGGRAQQWTP